MLDAPNGDKARPCNRLPAGLMDGSLSDRAGRNGVRSSGRHGDSRKREESIQPHAHVARLVLRFGRLLVPGIAPRSARKACSRSNPRSDLPVSRSARSRPALRSCVFSSRLRPVPRSLRRSRNRSRCASRSSPRPRSSEYNLQRLCERMICQNEFESRKPKEWIRSSKSDHYVLQDIGARPSLDVSGFMPILIVGNSVQ